MRFSRYHRYQSGQSLIELLVALTIIVMVIVAVVGLAAVSIKLAYFAKSQTAAKRYADEAIEWIREYRKNNWYDLLNNRADDNKSDIDFCLNSLDFNSSGPCTDFLLNNMYKRELKLYRYDIGVGQKPKVEATVVVSWSDKAGIHKAEVTSVFTSPD